MKPYPGPHWRTLRWPGILSCCLVHKHKQQSEPWPQRLADNSNIAMLSRGLVSVPTPAWHLSLWATLEWERVQPLSRSFVPELCMEVSPTISRRDLSTFRTNSSSFPPERWHSTSQQLVYKARGQDVQVPILACHIFYTAPETIPFPCGWWANGGQLQTRLLKDFQLFSLATPFGQSTSNLCHDLLARPSTSVPNFATFDYTVLLVAIDLNGRQYIIIIEK